MRKDVKQTIGMNTRKADSDIAEAGIQYQNQSHLSAPVLEAAID
jgi:hypothetical protein